ncbi:Similar to Tlr13: Toll-like receptor 13 (Mus musculus) [Cotesia congregata]|uniref:Similar to Tlr13: Toll-like receptor 13 (Mus musculus) n=1 Tax=Cotesia congregata TaxID=51543 RepID=A0A8J2HP60_COTCN|nr:Similar to Tlr13: Toll-like receptor 13 (Mus musculus) [Cotesia congregata]
MILKSAFLFLILSSVSTASNGPAIAFDFANKNITSLDGRFYETSKLTFIHAPYNKISKVDSSLFAGLPNLYSLDLTANPIDWLNLNLTNLGRLVLDGALRNFSESFGKMQLSIGAKPGVGVSTVLYLPTLRELYLRYNRITQIDGLTEETVPNLVYLDLSYNDIEYLDFLDKLPKSIAHLCLNNNKILKFVHERMPVKSLGLYAVAETVIEKYDFNHLENLQYLDISRNKIEKIEDGTFKNLSKLITLYLNNNYLSSLPDFSGLTHIKKLDLSNNYLSPISATAFDYLPTLEELNTFGNSDEY